MNTTASVAPSQHLTEDQLDDHLIGDLAEPAAAHLAACDLCATRVAQANSPLTSFQSVSLAWSERVSATAPIPSLSSARSLLERRLAWSMAIAACAVGLGLTGLNHRLPPPVSVASSSASQTVATPPTEAQLSSDNQLLGTIDNELSVSAETPAALGLVPVSATTRPRPTRSTYQD
jgi:hypothetical protein